MHTLIFPPPKLFLFNLLHLLLLLLQLSSALLFDAVHVVVAAVQELNRSQNVGATMLSCKTSKIWEHGTSLMNYLRMVRPLPPLDGRGAGASPLRPCLPEDACG